MTNFTKHNHQVKIFKMLGNSNRLRIIEIIVKNKEMSVTQIAKELKLEQSLVSQHLINLRKNDIIRAEQRKLNMYYSIKDPAVFYLLKC